MPPQENNSQPENNQAPAVPEPVINSPVSEKVPVPETPAKSKLNKEIKYAFLLVLTFLLVVAGAFGVWYFLNPVPEPEEIMTLTDSTQPTVQTAEVTPDSQNVGDFVGYYTQKKYDYGEMGAGACDALKVKGGDEALIKYYKDMVNYGNSINSIDMDGDLVLNIIPYGLSKQDQDKILNSSSTNMVTLTMKKKKEEGKGAAPCFSFLDILSVK